MDPDRDYQNSAFILDGETYRLHWQIKAAAFRERADSRLALRYGPGARQRFDLFLPEGVPRGLMVFVHGGYWMAGSRSDWSHLAAGSVARGWACAVPSYTLAPGCRIAAMTVEIARAVEAASALVAGPVVVAGHSAGGHLAARIACQGVRLAAPVLRVVPIAPLADLELLLATAMNATLRIDAAEAAAESPARLARRPGVEAHVWVGGQERPAFLWHARTLSEAWDCPWTVDPGRHHFDVVAGLEDAASPLTEVLLGGL